MVFPPYVLGSCIWTWLDMMDGIALFGRDCLPCVILTSPLKHLIWISRCYVWVLLLGWDRCASCVKLAPLRSWKVYFFEKLTALYHSFVWHQQVDMYRKLVLRSFTLSQFAFLSCALLYEMHCLDFVLLHDHNLQPVLQIFSIKESYRPNGYF